MKRLWRKAWARIKSYIPKKMKAYVKSKLGIVSLTSRSPEPPLPAGVSVAELCTFMKAICVADATLEGLAPYIAEAFWRFVYTYGLVRDLRGKCLELGANPYYFTMLMDQFTDLDVVTANYFGPHITASEVEQEVLYKDFQTGKPLRKTFRSRHFNIEEEKFPFADGEFDLVLFCEIIEHLLMDPAAVLREIRRILKPGGALVLTTPNVNRLENVARMIAGENIYDPYSGYGPYGRHNREYSARELRRLLEYLGFGVDVLFTADVHPSWVDDGVPVARYAGLLQRREKELGQYIFLKARNQLHRPCSVKKPAFLYRSYPAEQLDPTCR